MVECKVCGKQYHFLPSHIRVHNITVDQYKKLYPGSKLASEEHCNSISINRLNKGTGERNSMAKLVNRIKVSDAKKIDWVKRLEKFGKSGVKNPEQRSRRVSESLKNGGAKEGWEVRRKLYGKSGFKNLEELKEIRRVATKKSWDDYSPTEREERLFKNFNKCRDKPNFLEKRVLGIIRVFDLPFEYTGDKPYPGLGGWSPDFISIDNSKKIIEFYGDYWHNIPEVKLRDFRRSQDYKKQGFNFLIIWEHELKSSTDEEIVARIENFLKNG